MGTGQTILSMAALMFLSTSLLNFYRLLGSTGDDIASAQDGILGTTICTSYMELASGLAFDSYTDTSEAALTSIDVLTVPGVLGPEIADEDSVSEFNDFDDFNNFEVEKTAGGTSRKYKAKFNVYYVNPLNISSISFARTYVKRLDVKIWRTFPHATEGSRLDTLRMSQVMGYFHFD